MKKQNYIIIALILLILGGIFYWYELRPSMIRKNCSVSSSAFYTEQDKRWLQNRKDEGMSKEEAFKILDGIKEELEPKNQSKAEIEEEQLSRYKKCLSDEGLKE